MTDSLQKFLFDDKSVRGELVELNATWTQMLTHHSYPTPVQHLLGELCCAAALLCANLKFHGSMIMQIHGQGGIQLLVVECNHKLQLRAMAKLAPNAVIADDATLVDMLNGDQKNHSQNTRFVITLDPSDKSAGQQAYQGIVPIEGETVAAIVENYMKQSEQLDTKLWLASDNQVCRGMLLQRLPLEGGTSITKEEEDNAEETWLRACAVGGTLQRDELLTASTSTLMHRLFWDETLRIFDPQTTSFSCSCSREKVGNMLVLLGKEEVTEAVNELGKLDINCDFCGKPYSFDAVDCAQLFLPPETKLSADMERKH